MRGAEGRLRQHKRLGRTAEAPALGRLHKCLQVAELHCSLQETAPDHSLRYKRIL